MTEQFWDNVELRNNSIFEESKSCLMQVYSLYSHEKRESRFKNKLQLAPGVSNDITLYGINFSVCVTVEGKKRPITSLTFDSREDRTRFIKAFASDVEKLNNIKDEKLIFRSGSSWDSSSIRRRSWDSVFSGDSAKQELMEDIKIFLSSREDYHSKNIPWRRGYMLHGPPGNGKTSMAHAIASSFGYPIYNLNLKLLRDMDKNNGDYLSSIQYPCTILIEDIDAVSLSHSRTSSTYTSDSSNNMSVLLNLLDGVGSSEDMVVVATTNNLEILEPALLRPGRFDFTRYLGYATQQVMEDMLRFFLMCQIQK